MTFEAIKPSIGSKSVDLVRVGGRVMTRAEAESGGHKPAARSNMAQSQRSSTAPAVPAKPVQSAASARAAERQRWEDVMLSDRVKGKERIAAAMLASGDESSAEILGKLANIRTDAERERAKALERQQSAAGVWDRAIGKAFGTGGEA